MKMRGVLLAGAVVLSCLAVTGRAQAQSSIYLDIPGVQGEVVTPAAFANQIEVLSISLGGVRVCGTGNLSMSSVNLMKSTDRSTVELSTAMRDGAVYATATFRFTRSDGQVYQTYVLSNARVESLQTSGSAGGADRTTESVSFVFSQLTISYQYFDGSGKASGPLETMTFTAGPCS
jgi:type VI secretion system secreted protein Hcp